MAIDARERPVPTSLRQGNKMTGTKATGAPKLGIELFATNLHAPTHMEWTPDGRLLVSEHTAGQVKDITSGGDMAHREPLAYGLRGPASILPLDDGRILVSELWSDRVTDISAGGDVSNVPPFAEGLTGPYSLTVLNGRIAVVEHVGQGSGQITEITDGGGRTNHRVVLSKIPSQPMPGLEGLTPPEAWPNDWPKFFFACADWKTRVTMGGETFLVVNSSPLGQILRVPDHGGDYLDFVEQGYLLASGLGWMGGMIQHPTSGSLFVTQPLQGTIAKVDLAEVRDYRFDPAVVQGLNTPTCIRFSPDGNTAFVCSIPTGSIWKISNLQ